MKYVIQISYNGLHRHAGCEHSELAAFRWFPAIFTQKEKPQGFKQVVTVSEKRGVTYASSKFHLNFQKGHWWSM